jgi:hypothetical protein
VAESLAIPHAVYPSVAAAIAAAVEARPAALLVTGSLFVAGEGREAFGLAEVDRVWREIDHAARGR